MDAMQALTLLSRLMNQVSSPLTLPYIRNCPILPVPELRTQPHVASLREYNSRMFCTWPTKGLPNILMADRKALDHET